MKGLYFYKLNSPYQNDVTKDCKLTINEIDSNFINLKDADIKDVSFDKDDLSINLVRNNDEVLTADLSSVLEGVVNNLEVDYNSVEGTITLTHNDEEYVIRGLITTDNLPEETLTEVISDGTLIGLGSKKIPLGIAPVEKTGTYKPAFKLIDTLIGEELPHRGVIKGDRYVTKEEVSEYGYLYNFSAVKRINEDLKNGWRVPTKEDWDNVLNAIEPCDQFKNHGSAIANNMLGKFAGKLLKSRTSWNDSKDYAFVNCDVQNDDWVKGLIEDGDDFDVDFETKKSHPNEKPIRTEGIDAYGLRLMPSGLYDGCDVVAYFKERGVYWTSTEINETDVYVKRFDYNKSGVVQNVESPRAYFSLRLVKDYDGSNHHDVEYINGMNYRTVMLPSENAQFGYTIWTVGNAAFPNEKYHPFEPNNGENLGSIVVYNINEWNGFEWEVKQMYEGESIVLMTGLDGDHNIEYRIVNGELYSEAQTIYDKIKEDVQDQLDEINEEIEGLDERLTQAEEDVKDLQEKTSELREDLDKEIQDRTESDNQLQENIDQEEAAREEADILIHEEMERIEKAVGLTVADLGVDTFGIGEDSEQQEGGNYISRPEANYISESTTVMEAIDLLDSALKAEEDARIEKDNQLQEELDDTQKGVGLNEDGSYPIIEEGNYVNEATSVIESIIALDEALKTEEEARIKLQEELDNTQENIGLDEEGNYTAKEDANYISETVTIVDAIETLDSALKAEENARIEKDNQLQEELDATQGAIGTTEEGEYIKTDGKFTKDASSVMEAIKALDESLEFEETARIAEDERQWARMIVNGEHSNEVPYYNPSNALESDGKVAFDCANGVLTLFTNDGSDENKIIIRLNGDYGVIPYEE